MSSISEEGNGGTLRLSGRKSIHNHGSHCPFWHSEAMGRYGLSSKCRQEQKNCNTSHEGADEVDNVMSKLARASSPMSTRKNENYRRNSLNSPNKLKQNYTDDTDEDSEEAEEGNRINYTNESLHSPMSQSRHNVSGSSGIYNTPSQNAHNVRRNMDESNFITQQSANKGCNKLLLSSVIVTALVGVAAAYVFTATSETSSIIYDKYSFYADVKDVGSKYKINDNSILQVRAGIATIFERQDTGSFIFAYNSRNKDFNPVNFNNFINEMASAAARYLRNHTKTVQHVVVDTSNLQVQSEKEMMTEYIDDVHKTGVMLVKDLDRVPTAVVMAFHYYCDEYNPLVKKSAIFFTLNVARCSNMSSEKYTHEIIEKCLAEKWVKMPQDNLRPLLNRVVNVVIDVTSDF